MTDSFGAPPTRHRGSRTVNREPTVVRAITTLKDNLGGQIARIRREEIIVAPADWTRGEPAIAATMTSVLTTRVYRSGHALYFDIAAGLGDDGEMQLQLAVPDLNLTGPPVSTGVGGTEQDVRLQLAMPTTWQMGADYRVFVQAMRVSGTASTTVRALRAWQR